MTPGIYQPGAVRVREREVAARPKTLVEVGVQHLEQPSVDVGEDVFLAPFHPKGVWLCAESGMKGVPLDVGSPPGIVGFVGPPVQCTGDDVVSSLPIRVVVAARLDNVNLSRLGPVTIFVLDRQHPNGRPEPIARRESCRDFDPTILDGGTFLSVDTARLDRRDDGAVGEIGDSMTIHVYIRRAIGEVDLAVGVDQVLVLQCGLDVQFSAFDEYVLIGGGGLLELAIAAKLVRARS